MEKKIDEVETTNKIIVAHLKSWVEYQVSLYKKDKNSYWTMKPNEVHLLLIYELMK